MDPTNNPPVNPTPTPAPTPTPVPGLGQNGIMQEPAGNTLGGANGAGQPVAPTPSVPPVSPAPVNPVMPDTPTPVNPVFQPTGRVAATDPIMKPEPAPAPDPIEEELKAPMKAAGPVPGSIGSAVSGPSEAVNAQAGVSETVAGNPFSQNMTGRTPSVSFNDPATQPDATQPAQSVVPGSPTKKKNRMTLIILIIVAGIVVVALAAVLIMQLIGNSNASSGSPTSNNTVVNPPVADNPTVASTTELNCVRDMTETELALFEGAASGDVIIDATFSEDGLLSNIILTKALVYPDETGLLGKPVEEEVYEVSGDKLSAENFEVFELTALSGEGVELTAETIETNYENLDFICEAL